MTNGVPSSACFAVETRRARSLPPRRDGPGRQGLPRPQPPDRHSARGRRASGTRRVIGRRVTWDSSSSSSGWNRGRPSTPSSCGAWRTPWAWICDSSISRGAVAEGLPAAMPTGSSGRVRQAAGRRQDLAGVPLSVVGPFPDRWTTTMPSRWGIAGHAGLFETGSDQPGGRRFVEECEGPRATREACGARPRLLRSSGPGGAAWGGIGRRGGRAWGTSAGRGRSGQSVTWATPAAAHAPASIDGSPSPCAAAACSSAARTS